MVYIAIGSFDSAYDFSTVTGEIVRHDAERALSAAYEIAVVLGLASLWPYDVRSWRGGLAAGVPTTTTGTPIRFTMETRKFKAFVEA